MSTHAPIFWITRPVEDSAHTAASITAFGARAIINPVMRIAPVAHGAITQAEHAIITSKYAAEALTHLPRSTAIWAVGEKLAAIVRDMGFGNVHSFAKAQLLLKAFAHAAKPPSDVVYVRGETVRLDITAILRAQHYRIVEHVCYRTLGETALGAPLLQAFKHPEQVRVMLYATQAARFAHTALVTAAMGHLLPQLHACCISADVAEAAAHAGFTHIHTAARPDGTGMLMLAGDQIAASLAP